MTADFDTIREALQLHILGAASLNDWKIASDALSRVHDAAEQAEKALAHYAEVDTWDDVTPDQEVNTAGYPVFEYGGGDFPWTVARAALVMFRGKDTG